MSELIEEVHDALEVDRSGRQSVRGRPASVRCLAAATPTVVGIDLGGTNVAALAEAHDDELRMVAKNLVMLTLGTGMGGGLVLGGRVYRGATGGAGELGHTIVAADLSSPFRSASGFPQPGSLERVAAGSALDRLGADAAFAYPQSALWQRRAAGQSVLGADVVRAARAGDPTSAHVVETWAER